MTHRDGVTREGDGDIPFFFLWDGATPLLESMMNRLG
jgi:hypothetical protein